MFSYSDYYLSCFLLELFEEIPRKFTTYHLKSFDVKFQHKSLHSYGLRFKN